MADYTAGYPPLNTICPAHMESVGILGRSVIFGAISASFTFSSNKVVYFPFRVYSPATATKMSYIVGATPAGNVDLGIYDWQKNKLVSSGSTAQGTANTIQTLDITDTALAPGRYYMAFTGSSNSGTYLGISQADELLVPLAVMYEESPGSFGLPTQAAFAPSTTAAPVLTAIAVHFDTLV